MTPEFVGGGVVRPTAHVLTQCVLGIQSVPFHVGAGKPENILSPICWVRGAEEKVGFFSDAR